MSSETTSALRKRRPGGHPLLNWCSAFAMVLSGFSPFVLWSNYSASSTGLYLASRVWVSSGLNLVVADLSYSDLDDSICSTTNYTQAITNVTTNNFELFGDYGFCTGPDGLYTLPSEIHALRTFAPIAFAFALLAALFSSGVCAKTSKTVLYATFAALNTVLACAFSAATFAQMVSYNYFKDLRSGEADLIVRVTDQSLQGIPAPAMRFGPVFMTFVVVFVLLLFSSIHAIFTVFHNIKSTKGPATDDDDLINAQKTGAAVSSEITISQV